MNGYETEIYEAHSIPGGLCTSWKRGGYTIDGCLQWLTGSGPGNGFYRFWKERSPDDAETTELFCRLVWKFTDFKVPLC